MPAPKSLAGYPQWFFTIAERSMKNGYREELEMESGGAAINLRQKFYKFRQLLAEQKHPHAQGTINLVLTIRGNVLIFSQLGGLTSSALKQLGEDVTRAASPASAPDRIEVGDEAEEALNRLLGIEPASGGTSPSTPGSCEHEWDVQETYCVKCGVPKP